MATVNFSPVDIEARKKIAFKAGDTVRVWNKIQEKGKTRLQAFEGLVLARKHGTEAGATFTVRKVSNGIGVERIFPLFSPSIDSIELLKNAKTRRAKLYFIRDKAVKEVAKRLKSIVLGKKVVETEAEAEVVEETPAEEETTEETTSSETEKTA